MYINIEVHESPHFFGKILVFVLLDGSDRRLSKKISQELIDDLFSPYTTTANQAREQQQRVQQAITNLTNFVYDGFQITESYYPKDLFLPELTQALYKQRKFNIVPDIRYGIKTFTEEKKPEVSKVPEEIQKALALSEKALRYEKDIRNKIKEIEKEKKEYFKKYGTLSEKAKVYLKTKLQGNNQIEK